MRYTRQEVLHRFGISNAQLARWINRGIVPRSIIPPTGIRRDAYYTDYHIDRIEAIVATLIDGRVTINDLRERFHYEANPHLLDDGDTFDGLE